MALLHSKFSIKFYLAQKASTYTGSFENKENQLQVINYSVLGSMIVMQRIIASPMFNYRIMPP